MANLVENMGRRGRRAVPSVVRIALGEFARVLLIGALVASPSHAQKSALGVAGAENQSTFLELGKPLERQMHGGEKHLYWIHADAGQYVHVVVLQKGIDVALTLFDSTGKQIQTMDSINGSYGPEPLSAIAENSEDLRVEVSSQSVDAPTGPYQIQLADLRAPSESDRRRIEAERISMEANTLNFQEGVEPAVKAAAKWEESLGLWQSLGDQYELALALNNIGNVKSFLGETDASLDYFGRALPLWRASGDPSGEAVTLNNIGGAYASRGEQRKALDYYNQALPVAKASGDRSGEANTLNNLGGAYYELGEERKALEFFSQALSLQLTVGDRAAQGTTLNNIAGIYADLGEQQKALDYYFQALPLRSGLADRTGEATTLSNIGGAYADLGQKQKALEYYNQVLPIVRSAGFRVGEAGTLNNIGRIYDELGEKQKALECYLQSLSIERAMEDRAHEATTLSNIAGIYLNLGETGKALESINQALPIFREIQNPLREGDTLMLLMEYWKRLQRPSLAVLFGKQAIDRFQQMRSNIGGLEKEDRQSFLKLKGHDFRDLAEILISLGRLPEAQQVLDLLKAEEYSELTQLRGGTGSATTPVSLTPTEESSNREYEQITNEITAIGAEWTQLHAKSSKSADEEKRYTEISAKLTTANQRLQTFLDSLYNSFGKGDQANARVETINEQTSGLQDLIGDLGPGTVALYTLVLDDKVVIMVITPATRLAREVPITKTALRNKVFLFARSLADRDSETDIQAKAQDLYNILIAPVEHDLEGVQAKTLVWSLDDVLRYIPLAALYDGKRYFVERYENVVITTASASNLKDQPHVGRWSGLAMGVSKDYDGLGQLKAVPGELDSIIRSEQHAGSHGPVPGTILLDDSFTQSGMESALEQRPSLVHIASHYIFQPGDDKKSYLLLGGKETGGQGFHLTLADLRDDPKMDFKGVELLALSGCQTAVGSNDSDGREIDGLGITAQRKGAKAVVATLWPVDDASVGLLMATFYKLWIATPGITKVEALREAQIAVMHGTTDSAGTTRGVHVSEPGDRAPTEHLTSQYSNPYFWAPFILIGNWK